MSYVDLGNNLQMVGARLIEVAPSLSGVAVGKAADKLSVALRGFSKVIEESLRGSDPGATALRELVAAGFASGELDAAGLKLVAKASLHVPLTVKKTDSPEDLAKRFSDVAVTKGGASAALSMLRGHLAAARRPLPEAGDREAVLADLWRIASLSADELEVEKPRLLANAALLRAMAAYTFIKATPKTPAKTLLPKLLDFARRVNQNTSR